MCREIKTHFEENGNMMLMIQPELCPAAEQQISNSKKGELLMKKVMCPQFTKSWNRQGDASPHIIKAATRDLRELYMSKDCSEALRGYKTVLGPVESSSHQRKPTIGGGFLAYACGIPKLPGRTYEHHPTSPKGSPPETRATRASFEKSVMPLREITDSQRTPPDRSERTQFPIEPRSLSQSVTREHPRRDSKPPSQSRRSQAESFSPIQRSEFSREERPRSISRNSVDPRRPTLPREIFSKTKGEPDGRTSFGDHRSSGLPRKTFSKEGSQMF